MVVWGDNQIKKASDIIEEIVHIVNQWKQFANETDVEPVRPMWNRNYVMRLENLFLVCGFDYSCDVVGSSQRIEMNARNTTSDQLFGLLSCPFYSQLANVIVVSAFF